MFRSFGLLNFEFVSNFKFRISDFQSQRLIPWFDWTDGEYVIERTNQSTQLMPVAALKPDTSN